MQYSSLKTIEENNSHHFVHYFQAKNPIQTFSAIIHFFCSVLLSHIKTLVFPSFMLSFYCWYAFLSVHNKNKIIQ